VAFVGQYYGSERKLGVGSDETQDPLPPEPAYIIYMANTARLGRHITKDDVLLVDRRRIEPQF
jgi:hypothetical protein